MWRITINQTEQAWKIAIYYKFKNEIIKEINQAHESSQNSLFDSQTESHFGDTSRSCVDQTGVTSLTIDDKILHNPKEKVEVLNNQVFTKENWLIYLSVLVTLIQ